MTNREAIIDYLTKELDRAVVDEDEVRMDVISTLILRFTSTKEPRTFNPDDTTRTED